MNGITVEYTSNEIQRIGKKYVIDNEILMRDFNLSLEETTHFVGEIFKSIDDTALAWALKYYNLSNNPSDRRE